MPSPFPGMDPYLEEPGLWPDVHTRIMTRVSDVLTEVLRPKYYVRIEERVYISEEGDPGRKVLIPDIEISVRPEHKVRGFALRGGLSMSPSLSWPGPSSMRKSANVIWRSSTDSTERS